MDTRFGAAGVLALGLSRDYYIDFVSMVDALSVPMKW